jgi:flagellar biosynthesis GTPase FlhF
MLVFEDRSLSLALDRVRRALGPHALILRVESVGGAGSHRVRVRAAAGNAPQVISGSAARRSGSGAAGTRTDRPQTAHAAAPVATVALIGPAGCGKSTAAVKLAAHLEHDRGFQVELIHLEGDDPDLARLARAAGGDGRSAITPHRGLVRVIDTAGVSMLDEAALAILAGRLREVRPTRVPAVTHLVLPATTCPEWARQAADLGRDIGANRLLLTQIDNAEPTALVRLARGAGLRLSYLSDSPVVTDGLVGRRAGEILQYLSHGDGHAAAHGRAA